MGSTLYSGMSNKHQIDRTKTAVDWLNLNGKIHGNLVLDSIFVDKEGDWKLGGFEFLTEVAQLSGMRAP